jgi:hypothetical protein
MPFRSYALLVIAKRHGIENRANISFTPMRSSGDAQIDPLDAIAPGRSLGNQGSFAAALG